MPLARGLAAQFESSDHLEAAPLVVDQQADGPQLVALSATIDQLRATVAEQAAQLAELAGPVESLALGACDRRGYSYETLRHWCETGVVESRRDGGRIFVNMRSLTARFNRLGLAKAIRAA